MIRNFLIGLLGTALALFIITLLLPHHIWLDWHQPVPVLAILLLFGVVNSLVRPIIMFFLWPVNCLTFGLLGFCLNVLLFFVVGQLKISWFHVTDLLSALIGSILMGLISGAIGYLLRDRGQSDAE